LCLTPSLCWLLLYVCRSTRTTNQILLAIHALSEQLLHVLYSIRHAVYALAAAASSYLASLAAAQQAARLHAAISSGRLIMLLTMTLLALLNTRTAFSRRCLGSAGSSWTAAVQKAVTSWASFLGANLQQKQQPSMLWSLAAPARSIQCMLAFTGERSSVIPTAGACAAFFLQPCWSLRGWP
jgi:hypothetical protein